MKKYRLREHISDGYIEAWGTTIEEAFESAGLGLFDLMTELTKVEPRDRKILSVEGEDLEALLFEWLSALIYEFDTTNTLLSKFKITEIVPKNGGYRLNAEAWGEAYDPAKHRPKVAVKAATYNRMEIKKSERKSLVRYVVDL